MTSKVIPLIRALTPRIKEEDVSYRTKMVEIAATLQDVIALGRGDPDFATPAHILEATKQALDAGQTHYTHPAGIPELREAIAQHLRLDYGLDYTSDEIMVTAGVQEAMMLCMMALVNPDDEVLLPNPRFTSYDTAIHMCGGVVVDIPTVEANDFALMPEDIEHRITPRSKVLVLITPNNPTGAVTPPDAIRKIAEIAQRHNLIVLSDEIYARLIYGDCEHLSIATLPGMKERTITLNGFSKTYAMTGFRVGYMAAPAELIRLLIEPRHTLSINASTPSQYAALAALTGPQEDSAQMYAEYDKRRLYLIAELDRLGLSYGHPGGAFYIYANVEKTGYSGPEFCERLLRETRVLVFPGTLFGDRDERYIRFSLLQPLSRIREAIRRIHEAKEKLFVHII